MAYDPANIFARILRGEIPAHRIFEDDAVVVIMDAMPQSEGHALVIPKAAAEDLFDLPPDMAAEVMRTGQRVALAVRQAFRPAGITLMQFNGAEAGQTVFHFHLHIVPRYAGQPLRTHGRSLADPAVLAEHAQRVRAALKGAPDA
ncbi:MAG: HIT family protein [Gammaproteobacteria bacterium]